MIESHVVDLDQVEIEAETTIEEASIFKMLDEIGLMESEIEFINLIIKNHSIDEMTKVMNVSRSRLFEIKASIRDKILTWGQDN